MELKHVIRSMFTRGVDTTAGGAPGTPAHAVFLCELGSQKRDEKIDAVFHKRQETSLPQPTKNPNLGLCNLSGSLDAYLCRIVRMAGLDTNRFVVWARAPIRGNVRQ